MTTLEQLQKSALDAIAAFKAAELAKAEALKAWAVRDCPFKVGDVVRLNDGRRFHVSGLHVSQHHLAWSLIGNYYVKNGNLGVHRKFLSAFEIVTYQARAEESK